MAVAWAVALVLGACAVTLARFGWEHLPHARPLEELSYYPSGQHLRPATLGHPETAADLAWLRAVQYYGEHRLRDNHFERMDHVFDIISTLAPRFVACYVFGAFALAQEGQDFPAAEALMQKGLDANPKDAELAFQAGFLYYVKTGGRDLRHAAEYFELSARLPNAPPQAARFAAFSRQNAGDLHVAYALWKDVAEHSPNAYLREMAQRNLEEIGAALAARRPEMAIRKLATPRVQVGH